MLTLICVLGASGCFAGLTAGAASANTITAGPLTLTCFQGGCFGGGRVSGLFAETLVTAPVSEAIVCLDASWAPPCSMNGVGLILAPRFLTAGALIAEQSFAGLTVVPNTVFFGFKLGRWQPVAVLLVASNGAIGKVAIGNNVQCLRITSTAITAGPC